MTFGEFKEKYDKHNVFQSFTKIENAKYIELIPKDYHEYFPNKCECGSDNIITYDLQQPQCCNPKCLIKQGYALSELFTRFKCKGLGPARCIEIVKKLSPMFKYNSYIEVLNMEYKDFPMDLAQKAYTQDLLFAINKIKSQKMTFAKMVSSLAIPTLGEKSTKLLDGINSFDEFQNVIRKEGTLDIFCHNRGIHDQMVLFWIRNSAYDMCIADTILHKSIRMAGIIKIEVCITGFLHLKGKRITKDEFIKICNDVSIDENGIQLFEVIQNTAKVGASHIIADVPSSSAKYLAGLRRGSEIDIDGVRRSVLMTSTEFLGTLEEMKSKWVEERKRSSLIQHSNPVEKTKENLQTMTSF